MAKYRITDNQSGKTLVISGDTPPSEQEAEQLFQESGIRNQQSQMTSKEAQSRIAPVPPVQQIDPITQAAGKAQEFLGNSPLLPILGASVARAAVPIPGVSSMVGGAFGERLKQSAKVGGPMEALKAFIPSLEQNPEVRNQVAQTGLVSGATDLATTAGSKVLGNILKEGKELVKGGIETKSINPRTILGYLRDQATDKYGNLNTKKLFETAEQFVADNPYAKEAWETFKPTLKENMSSKDLLRKMSDVFGNAYTKTGDARVDAVSGLLDKLYRSGKGIMKEQAPEVAKYTEGFRKLITAPKDIQKITWLMAKLGLAKGAF